MQVVHTDKSHASSPAFKEVRSPCRTTGCPGAQASSPAKKEVRSPIRTRVGTVAGKSIRVHNSIPTGRERYFIIRNYSNLRIQEKAKKKRETFAYIEKKQYFCTRFPYGNAYVGGGVVM